MQENIVESVSANVYRVIFAVKREAVAIGLFHSNRASEVYNILIGLITI